MESLFKFNTMLTVIINKFGEVLLNGEDWFVTVNSRRQFAALDIPLDRKLDISFKTSKDSIVLYESGETLLSEFVYYTRTGKTKDGYIKLCKEELLKLFYKIPSTIHFRIHKETKL